VRVYSNVAVRKISGDKPVALGIGMFVVDRGPQLQYSPQLLGKNGASLSVIVDLSALGGFGRLSIQPFGQTIQPIEEKEMSYEPDSDGTDPGPFASG
jgi:hypothetical protein